ncbi:MAG TPA: hypothetical protein PKH77_26435 [Anaerolineae bacterium]|nr:hypothetical protein [Anaerolineae bacterium]
MAIFVTTDPLGGDVQLREVTIQGDNTAGSQGLVVNIGDGPVRVTDCAITRVHTGIYVSMFSGSLTLTASEVQGTTYALATEADDDTPQATLTVEQSRLTGGAASAAYLGGTWFTATLRHTHLSGGPVSGDIAPVCLAVSRNAAFAGGPACP